MRSVLDKLPRALQLVCVVMAALLALQIRDLASDPVADDAEAELLAELVPETRSGLRPEEESSPAAAAPTLPERLEAIAVGGAFGVAPPPPAAPAPALIGVLGDLAIFRFPDNKELAVERGQEAQGIRVLDIATNRVLVEHGGRRLELTLYEGVGSQPLSTPEKSTEETAKEPKP